MNRLQSIQNLINTFAEIESGHEDGNAEAIQTIANKLGVVLSRAANAEFTRAELTDFVLSDNDPLDGYVDGISDNARDEVREIQHAIINTFGE